MRKVLKIFGWIVGVVILLLVVAVIAVPLVVDTDKFKNEITDIVGTKTGRKLIIEGDLKLSLFPWLGAKISQVALANPPGYQEPLLARVKQMEIRVKPLALLKRQVEMDTVVLEGLTLHLEKNSSGKGNWEDLLQPGKKKGTKPESGESRPASQSSAIAGLAVAGLAIRNAYLSWDDEVAEQHYVVDELSLHTGKLLPGEPTEIEAAFHIADADAAFAAKVKMTGELNVDPGLQTVQLQDLKVISQTQQNTGFGMVAELHLQGAVQADLATQTVQVSDFAITANGRGKQPDIAADTRLTAQINGNFATQNYQVNNLNLTANLRGETLPGGKLDVALAADMDVDLVQQTLMIPKLRLETLGLDVAGQVTGKTLLDNPQLDGTLKSVPFNGRQLLERLGQEPLRTADPTALEKAAFATRFAASPTAVALHSLTITVDDSILTGTVAIPDFAGPAMRFDLAVDTLDIDRYLPPAAQNPKPATPGAATVTAAANSEVPLKSLRTLTADGRLRVGKLRVAKLAIRELSLPVEAQRGKMRIDPVTAKLYRGAYRGNIVLNAGGARPVITLDESLTHVQAGPLLKDLLGEERLTGTADVAVKLRTEGVDTETLIHGLNGKGRFLFVDGAVKGINIARLIREAKARFEGKQLPPEPGPLQTDFAELRGTVTLTNGMASNTDLYAKSPLLRVTGEGTANLVKEQLNYLLTATVVATTKGQGGKDLQDLEGVSIPIRIEGNFDQPQVALDLEALLKSQAEALVQKKKKDLLKKVEEGLDEKLKKQLGDQPQELLRKLFQ